MPRTEEYPSLLCPTSPHHSDTKSEASTDNDDLDHDLSTPVVLQVPIPSKTYHPKNKTSLCKNFTQNGHCPYGSRCQFAHGLQELKANSTHHPTYKTKECQVFRKKGHCEYGERCNFIH